MTDNLKHSTSYYHEAIAHAFEMFKNGYEPVMETPFQPRRLGSAFVTEYKAVRESFDEAPQLTISQKWEIDAEIEAEFVKLLEQSEPLPKALLASIQDLRDKAEANAEKQTSRDIFKEIMEGIKEMEENPEGCVSTLVKVDKERLKVYSKSELDEMHWNELKPILDAAGIRGRRRANLIRDFLKYQEEQ